MINPKRLFLKIVRLISGFVARNRSLRAVPRRILKRVSDFFTRHRREIVWAAIFAIIAGAVADRGLRYLERRNEEQALRRMRGAVAIVLVFDKQMAQVSQGSGIFIDNRGKLVTNHHVVKVPNWQSIWAKLPSGAYYKLKEFIGDDKDADVAILQFEAEQSPFVKLGDSDNIESGRRVLAIGAPLGLENSVSEGVISFPKRKLDGIEVIQFTAPISSGSSGGGLFDVSGRLLGITMGAIPAQLQKDIMAQNLNFAVPINVVREALKGRVKRFTEESPEYFYQQGVVAENRKEYDQALEFFNRALQLDDKYADAYIELANIYFERGSFDDQLRVLEKAKDLVPNNADVWASLAGAYEDLGLYDKAIDSYNNALRINPSDKNSMHELGILYLVRSEKGKAMELVPRLTRLDPGLGNQLKVLITKMK